MKKNIYLDELPRENGQSLIETIVGIFVLTVGLTSGLGLAIYSFGASSNIVEQLTATGLAREAVEVIRSMRDSNWLAEGQAGGLSDCEDGQRCYQNWLTEAYNIQGSTGQGTNYLVTFQPGTGGWLITQASGANPTLYQLSAFPSNNVFTHQTGGNLTNYFRKVTIIQAQNSSPYTPTSPLVLVRAVVWWYGKNCNNNLTNYNPPTNDTSCKIVTEEYLTNWKNY